MYPAMILEMDFDILPECYIIYGKLHLELISIVESFVYRQYLFAYFQTAVHFLILPMRIYKSMHMFLVLVCQVVDWH